MQKPTQEEILKAFFARPQHEQRVILQRATEDAVAECDANLFTWVACEVVSWFK